MTRPQTPNTHALQLPPLPRFGILAALVILLVGTATDHFGPLPNAAPIVFFLAGFYVGSTRWVLPLLILLALGTDYIVVTSSGQSFWTHHCVSVAYWFLVPAYVSMWLGGTWLRSRYRPEIRSLPFVAAALLVSFTMWFTLTNGSFYWLSGRYADPHWAEFVQRYVLYYTSYLRTTLAYAAFAALLHVQTLLLLRLIPRLSSRSAS